MFLPSRQCLSRATTSLPARTRHATEKGLGFCGCLLIAAEKRWIVFLFLRTVPRKMPHFSTLEGKSTREKVINVGKLWSITALVRSTGWLISPASVEAITLQLQSDLFCSFRSGCLCQNLPCLKTHLCQNLPCLGTHLCQNFSCLGTHFCHNPFSLYDDTSQTPFCLSGDFPEYRPTLRSSGMSDMPIHSLS